MKKILLLLIFIPIIAFADWKDSARDYLATAEQTQQRHIETINQLEQTSEDLALSEKYQLLRRKWYALNITLINLEWQEKQAQTVEEKEAKHLKVTLCKKDLDDAFNELKNFVNSL
jgi:hypothetical protein